MIIARDLCRSKLRLWVESRGKLLWMFDAPRMWASSIAAFCSARGAKPPPFVAEDEEAEEEVNSVAKEVLLLMRKALSVFQSWVCGKK